MQQLSSSAEIHTVRRASWAQSIKSKNHNYFLGTQHNEQRILFSLNSRSKHLLSQKTQ